MLLSEATGDGTGRTWRPPVKARAAMAAGLGGVPVLAGLWLALALVTNQVANGGWIALALAAAAWGLLAWRALAQSVTLTRDTLVIRNILVTRQVPLADLVAVGFGRGRLTVTSARGAAPSERLTVGAVDLGSSRWSGRRGDADAIAAAIADAAGLPPPPPRGEMISRNWSWLIFLAAVMCIGLGVYCGPLRSGNIGLPFGVREAGTVLYPVGTVMAGFAFRINRGYRRQRTQGAGGGWTARRP